jgi:hypothetical protein
MEHEPGAVGLFVELNCDKWGTGFLPPCPNLDDRPESRAARPQRAPRVQFDTLSHREIATVVSRSHRAIGR